MPKPDGPQFFGDDGAYAGAGKDVDIVKDSLVFNDEGTKIVTHPIDRIIVRTRQAFKGITNDLKTHLESLPQTEETMPYLDTVEQTVKRAQKHAERMLSSLSRARYHHDQRLYGTSQQHLNEAALHMANYADEYISAFNVPGHPLSVSVAKNMSKVGRQMLWHEAEQN